MEKTMKTAVRLMLCIAAASVALPLCAAQRTWIGPDNGKWSVAANWSGGVVPSGKEESAEFTNATPMNVEIDVEDTVLAVYFGDRDATPPEKGSGYIRFFGNGSITQTSSYMNVFTNSCFILDGPTVNAKTFRCFDGAKVEVRSGSLNLSANLELTKDEGGRSEFLVCGGILKASSVVPYDRSEFAMTSGKLWLTGTSGRVPDLFNSSLSPSEAFRVTGGEIVVNYRFTLPALKRLDVEADKISIGGCIHPLSGGLATRLDVFSDMTFGAFGDWNFNGREATVNLYGDTTVDTTDCNDGETGRSIFFANLSPMLDSSLSVTGVGTARLGFTSVAQHEFSSVSVGENATLDLGSTGMLRTDDLSLASGAKIALSAEGRDMLETYSAPVAAANSTIEVTLPAAPTAAAKYPVLVSEAGEIDDIPVTIANPSGTWGVERALGCIYLSDGNDVDPVQAEGEWRGGTSGYWSDTANWTGGVAPIAKNSYVYFSGSKNTVITNDVTSIDLLRQLYFYEGGPFVIRGRAFRISSTSDASQSAAIVSESSLPVRMEVDFTGTGNPYTGVYAAKNSFIELAGTTTILNWFSPGGDIRVSGALTTSGLFLVPVSGSVRSSRLTVLAGGSVMVTNQGSRGNGSAKTFPICVEDGGKFAITGGEAFWKTEAQTFYVNGTLDLVAPFSLSNMTMTVLGSGRMNVSSMKTISGATSKLVLGAGLQFCPATWATVTADGPDACFPIEIDSSATFLATNDWTYGVAEGVDTTTSAADRAIVIASPFGSLTVDTDDPDADGVSHTITFADPVRGSGSLVKEGAGTLVLASAENAVTGEVVVAEGTLRMTANQSFTSLSADGATLSFAPGVSATVSEDLDLDGVPLVVDGITGASPWTPVIVATGDAEISGTPTVAGGYVVKIVGGRVLVREKQGFVVNIK